MIQRKGKVVVIMTMTREKAIEILENHTQYYVPSIAVEVKEK